MQVLWTCCNTDRKSFQRLHLCSPGVTLMPHEPSASLLFDHQDFPSEMTTPGREEIRNEIGLKEEDHSVFSSPPALMLWVSQLGSNLWTRAAERWGSNPVTKELRASFCISPSYSPPKRVPSIFLGVCNAFVMWVSLPQAIYCRFHRGTFIFLSEHFRCPLPFSRFQPRGNHPTSTDFS